MLPVALAGLISALVAASASNPAAGSFFAAIAFMIMISALAYLGAWGVERALHSTQEARRELELANKALHGANSDLESRVTQRTVDLQQALDDLQQRETELRQTLDELRGSQATVRELSAPILPVSSGCWLHQ